MTEHGRCGVQLKTTDCKRAALWPGGRCSRHGYGAETLRDWILGAERAYECGISVHIFATSRVADTPTTWNLYKAIDRIEPGDRDKVTVIVEWTVTINRGHVTREDMSPEEAAVMADQLEADRYGGNHHVQALRRAVAAAFRGKMRLAGEHCDVMAAAEQVRASGVYATAVDDMLVIPRSSIADLLALLRR